MNYSKLDKYLGYIFSFSIIVFFVVKALDAWKKDVQLESNYKYTYAYIYKTSRSQSGASLDYFYILNTDTIWGTQSFGAAYSSGNKFLYKSPTVIYNRDNPSSSKLLLRKEEYKKFKLKRPKELDWVD